VLIAIPAWDSEPGNVVEAPAEHRATEVETIEGKVLILDLQED
jgi:hypothetical protein